MTAEIAAPAVGAVKGAAGEAPDTAVVFGVRLEPPSTGCEHPAMSNDTVTSAAIRIPSG
ncbi:hypothetical protein MLAC_20230 [Mycobacterium lacus]|uniref:Uncharacterized protein n=1 Tax=Mycobacterium lacus TaxID=169765 RepID=A0A7I7NK89_9MYCO|nr:hypothetical protein MLAC_20230 [Mycobacterium lacus]